MRNKGYTAFAGLLIALAAAPPIIHLAFGDAIKAHRQRAADDAQHALEKYEAQQ